MSDPDPQEDSNPVAPAAEQEAGAGGAAFDLWLQRRLHQLYGAVAAEPVPEALLRLIEADRKRR